MRQSVLRLIWILSLATLPYPGTEYFSVSYFQVHYLPPLDGILVGLLNWPALLLLFLFSEMSWEGICL